MPRLIDMYALEKDINELRVGGENGAIGLQGLGIAIYEAAIDRAIVALHEAEPVDAQLVVRCKDCKHSYNCFGSTKHLGCNHWDAVTAVDGFCNRGERRESNGQNSVGESP